MKHTNRKGFTKVELIVVIAVIAILAAGLISAIVSMNKQANQYADYQEKTTQQIADLTEKLEKSNYVTAEQLHKKLAEEIAKLSPGTSLSEDQINSIVNAAVEKVNKQPTTSLTEAQVKSIIKEALKGYGGLTDAQIQQLIKNELNK